MTEIADYYRLLFARVGEGGPAPGPLTSTFFSPNAEQGACPACKGLGTVRECDPAALITHPERGLVAGAMDGHKTGRFYGDPDGRHVATLRAAGAVAGVDFSVAWRDLDASARDMALHGLGDRELEVDWHYRRGTRTGVHRFRTKWIGLAGLVLEEYERKHADRRGAALEPLLRSTRCTSCGGSRLKPEALAVSVAGRSIAELLGLTVIESLAFFAGLEGRPERDWRSDATADLRRDVAVRLERLRDAGLGYLSLDRPAATLSAGEAQRIRLATEIGSGLTGITYVLDEPTAGLHPRDTTRLLGLLRSLRDTGNTVVVVEHDEDVIRAADHVIDLGPGAGDAGGHIVAAGPPEAIAASEASVTGRYLRRNGRAARPGAPRPAAPAWHQRGARQPAQPAGFGRRDSRRGARRRDRGFWQRQVHAAVRRRRSRPRRPPPAVRRPGPRRGRARAVRACDRRRPRPDRRRHLEYAGHDGRRLRRHPGAVRRHRRGAPGRPVQASLFDEHARGALRDVRGDRSRKGPHGLPAGRLGAVRRLPRPPVPGGSARMPPRRPVDRGRPGADRHPGARGVRRNGVGRPPARDPGRPRPRATSSSARASTRSPEASASGCCLRPS